MKKEHVYQDKEELSRGLLRVNKLIKRVKVEVPYQGVSFTLATATLPVRHTAKVIYNLIGEGISKKSHLEKKMDKITGYNIAVAKALESLDKKLRRRTEKVCHHYEG